MQLSTSDCIHTSPIWVISDSFLHPAPFARLGLLHSLSLDNQSIPSIPTTDIVVNIRHLQQPHGQFENTGQRNGVASRCATYVSSWFAKNMSDINTAIKAALLCQYKSKRNIGQNNHTIDISSPSARLISKTRFGGA